MRISNRGSLLNNSIDKSPKPRHPTTVPSSATSVPANHRHQSHCYHHKSLASPTPANHYHQSTPIPPQLEVYQNKHRERPWMSGIKSFKETTFLKFQALILIAYEKPYQIQTIPSGIFTKTYTTKREREREICIFLSPSQPGNLIGE